MKKIILSVLFVFVGSLFAAKPVTPSIEDAKAAGIKAITVAEAKDLYDKKVPFIDCRSTKMFAKGRVKGSKLVAYKAKGGKKEKKVGWDVTKDEKIIPKFLSKMPSDKSAGVIFYCQGETCWRAYKAAVVAQKNGYTNAYWFKNGYPAWKKAGYPVEP
ncbi:MAG: rhodanese-like domain-containing protein [Arcobacteraceae bacterium]|nr:rhodanese-like domain-containing protein [Arcobacteraceae bacterium]